MRITIFRRTPAWHGTQEELLLGAPFSTEAVPEECEAAPVAFHFFLQAEVSGEKCSGGVLMFAERSIFRRGNQSLF
jgi:hypothetical protein